MRMSAQSPKDVKKVCLYRFWMKPLPTLIKSTFGRKFLSPPIPKMNCWRIILTLRVTK